MSSLRALNLTASFICNLDIFNILTGVCQCYNTFNDFCPLLTSSVLWQLKVLQGSHKRFQKSDKTELKATNSATNRNETIKTPEWTGGNLSNRN